MQKQGNAILRCALPFRLSSNGYDVALTFPRALSEESPEATVQRPLLSAGSQISLFAWMLPSRLPRPPLKFLVVTLTDQFILTTPTHILHGLLDFDRVGVMGLSLGAIVTAQACTADGRIDACLMMDAPVPTEVAASGLRQPALWISRPADDQRLERDASGGWPEIEIAAQARTIAEALSNSERGQFAELHGLFHIDFTDLPAVQPVLRWLGQSGDTGVIEAHRQINKLTGDFFARSIGRQQE